MDIQIIKFKNLLEEGEDDICYGIKSDDERVVCLECGSTFEQDDYLIIEAKIVDVEKF